MSAARSQEPFTPTADFIAWLNFAVEKLSEISGLPSTRFLGFSKRREVLPYRLALRRLMEERTTMTLQQIAWVLNIHRTSLYQTPRHRDVDLEERLLRIVPDSPEGIESSEDGRRCPECGGMMRMMA